ncbi:hypothetical protein JNUCC1_00418 [Lentibacillus sp. JNUCC-1]|uniref:DUF1028 domain-containing protein n=1 Tax=Lentibacillus sp. JNUCC-1 TaxID=2654513 RepID=UPI0012E93F56|nr:DUF1028 domain-containing protein [Lentibacillus sp. JNUCC-1]MUV36615.1 hypothetical protein [Lentibacillus sp. JNUCC-1]
MTFSIAGYDPETGELGVAVQSKFLGVGSVVPWAKSGVGAVATQSYANPAYGPMGLDLLEQDKSAQETIDILTSQDEGRAYRQVGIVDSNGNAATFTGEHCYNWAGGRTGKHYAAQGNILVDENTVDKMAETFERTSGSLADRLLAALAAGQEAGGDKRGQQSAALYVVKKHGGYLGVNDHYIDLRVDDHSEPINELQRIYLLHQLYFGVTQPDDVLLVKDEIKNDVAFHLRRLGYISSNKIDESRLIEALTAFIHKENFENRELKEGQIDAKVLGFLKSKQETQR